MRRVGILGGAGAVGSATAATLITEGVAQHVILADIDAELLAVQQMDLDLLAGARGARVEAVAADQLAEADLIVMAAGVPHRDGAERQEFAAANLAILDGLLDTLPSGWPGVLLVASNPVDVLVTAAAHRLGAGARVLGYVANDALRLAQAVAEVRSCPADEVDAWALGEHGPGMVALLDRVTIGGAPARLDASEQEWVLQRALGWYDCWQQYGTGRTSMWVTGAGVAALVTAYTGPRISLEPVSVPLYGRYGVAGPVGLGVPALIGRGRAEVVEWPLRPAQADRLRLTASEVRRAAVRRAAPVPAHPSQ